MLRFFLIWAALCIACARPDERPLADSEPLSAVGSRVGSSGDGHLLITLELSGAALRVVDARRVPGRMQRLRGEAPGGDWEVEARSNDGALLHVARVAPPDVLRGEFAREGGELEGHHLQHVRSAFAVRLPVLPGARELRVVARDGRSGARRLAGRVAFPEVGR
ncbi:MAG TPA: hypothetical protein VFB81_02585 [Myxococcales bacterium]|nr:hypothetical protein [Myxococcales bacterium]